MTTEVTVSTATPKIEGRWKSAFSMAFAGMMDNYEGTGFITAMFPLIRAQLGMTLGMLGWMAALPKIMAIFFGPFWSDETRFAVVKSLVAK